MFQNFNKTRNNCMKIFHVIQQIQFSEHFISYRQVNLFFHLILKPQIEQTILQTNL